eukprot:15769168-Heterocapsa_arctica.AAC.1
MCCVHFYALEQQQWRSGAVKRLAAQMQCSTDAVKHRCIAVQHTALGVALQHRCRAGHGRAVPAKQ